MPSLFDCLEAQDAKSYKAGRLDMAEEIADRLDKQANEYAHATTGINPTEWNYAVALARESQKLRQAMGLEE